MSVASQTRNWGRWRFTISAGITTCSMFPVRNWLSSVSTIFSNNVIHQLSLNTKLKLLNLPDVYVSSSTGCPCLRLCLKIFLLSVIWMEISTYPFLSFVCKFLDSVVKCKRTSIICCRWLFCRLQCWWNKIEKTQNEHSDLLYVSQKLII